jgi:hypothetical protein
MESSNHAQTNKYSKESMYVIEVLNNFKPLRFFKVTTG